MQAEMRLIQSACLSLFFVCDHLRTAGCGLLDSRLQPSENISCKGHVYRGNDLTSTVGGWDVSPFDGAFLRGMNYEANFHDCISTPRKRVTYSTIRYANCRVDDR